MYGAKKDRILNEFRRYPCKILPPSEIMRISTRVGASKQWVSLLAHDEGYQVLTPLQLRQKWECICGKRLTKNELCAECANYVYLPCATCWEPVRTRISSYLARLGRKDRTYTERVYCDRLCFKQRSA